MNSFEYKPHDKYDARVVPTRCKASVSSGGRAPRYHQCQRGLWRDGWCKQHHPDSCAERERESRKRYAAQAENSTGARLDRARTRIAELEARLEAAVAALEAVEWCVCLMTMHGDIVDGSCPWCHRDYPDHYPDCQRQVNLAKARGQ